MKYISFFGAVCLFFLVTGCKKERTLYFNKGELTYTLNVKEEEAQKLGEILMKHGYFPKDKRVSVQLDKIDELYKVRLVVQDKYFRDTSKDEYLKEIAKEASAEAFKNSSLDIELCDFLFTSQRVIYWDEIMSQNTTVLPKEVEDELKALDDSIPEPNRNNDEEIIAPESQP
jgi:hypothetical protein